MASSESPGRLLYSVGDCPVCADSGVVLVVRANTTGAFIFFCPACGVAWLRPPSGNQLDDVDSLSELAPTGISLPNRRELAELEHGRVLREIPYDDWQADLNPHLRQQ